MIEVDTKRWLLSCILYNKLRVFSGSINKLYWPWWKHVSHYHRDATSCSKMLRLMVEFTTNHNDVCIYCNSYCVTSIEHLVFHCSSAAELRNKLWNDVVTCAPVGMRMSLSSMQSTEKYIREWGQFYSCCCVFLVRMFDAFNDLAPESV